MGTSCNTPSGNAALRNVNPRNIKLLAIMAALAAAIHTAGAAAADDIMCPATILASTAVTTAEGWEPVGGAAEFRLEQTQLYLGNPADDRPLPPESGSGDDQRWRLPTSNETWVGCTYSNTTVVLARKLDARLTQCVVKRETMERQGKGADSHTVDAPAALSCN